MNLDHAEPWVIVRLDDVRGHCHKQDRVCDVLEAHGVPIHLEVIPDDLDERGAAELHREHTRRSVPVMCHQHGYRHTNHGTDTKRCEFGDHRSFEVQLEDLTAGKSHLASLLGEIFEPLFSPPWDRYGETTLEAIEAAGLQGMSVLWKDGAPSHPRIPIIRFTLDPVNWSRPPIHRSWSETLENLLRSVQDGNGAGLQLHHEVMEEHDFVGLNETLDELEKNGVCWPMMKDLVTKRRES